jgi:hypothetical protein
MLDSWAIDYFGQFFPNDRSSAHFGQLFPRHKVCIECEWKIVWATFLALFSQTHPVALFTNGVCAQSFGYDEPLFLPLPPVNDPPLSINLANEQSLCT